MTDRELRRLLVACLEGRDALDSDGWRRAFEAVPRHVFVPRFTASVDRWQARSPGLDSSMPEQYEQWLRTVYSDQALLLPCEAGGASSSSMPSIMAYMLEALQVEDGNRVLEIGCGSGYQAALLCERLGSENVTSIDIDPLLVDAAERRLRGLGYQPVLAVADGAHGYRAGAPYDRLIGACYAWPIPRSWIEQTRPGGRICAIAPSSLARLQVREDGSAAGRLHWQHAGFTPMRGWNPADPPEEEGAALVRESAGEVRRCRHPARIVEAGGLQCSFWVLIGMLVIPHQHIHRLGDDVAGWIDVRDGSWLRLDPRAGQVAQGGPRRLWDEVEDLYEQWCRLGAPNRQRFGLTVEPDGRHVLWVDSPDSDCRWTVT